MGRIGVGEAGWEADFRLTRDLGRKGLHRVGCIIIGEDVNLALREVALFVLMANSLAIIL